MSDGKHGVVSSIRQTAVRRQQRIDLVPAEAINRFRVLSNLFERLRGMKCTTKDKEEGLHVVLVPCRDIHTFGMQTPLDVAFVDPTGTVVAVHRSVAPKRRIRNSAARLVVERSACEGAWFERGDNIFRLPWCVHREGTCSQDEKA